MPEHDGLGDVGTGAQLVLDERRRDGLAAGGDDEVAGSIDQSQHAAAPFADVTGAQRAVRKLHDAAAASLFQ